MANYIIHYGLFQKICKHHFSNNKSLNFLVKQKLEIWYKVETSQF